jgi:hypothetical protein
MLEAEERREREAEGNDEQYPDRESPEEEISMSDTFRDALLRNIAEGRGVDDESDEVTDDEAGSNPPELEDIPIAASNETEGPVFQGPVQRSMAATVSDDSSDGFSDQSDDHDAEYLLHPHPPPTHHIYAPRDPRDPQDHSRHTTAQATAEPDINDPQRIQRWLISTGLQRLQEDPSTIQEYVERLKVLRIRDRDWTLGIVRQRAGADVADRVSRESDR